MAALEPGVLAGAPPYTRRLVFAAACMGIFVFGVAVTALGSLLPSLMVRFGLGNAAAGSLFPLLTLGMLLGSLCFGPVVDRYGYKGLLACCVTLIALGLEGIAFGGAIPLIGASLAVIGVAGGAVNGATSALVADISEEGSRGAELSLLGAFFGLGAFGVPFLLSLLLQRLSYGAITAGVGVVAALPALYFLAIRFPPPKHAQGFPLGRGLALLRDGTLLLLGFCLFFESGMEMIASGWTAAYVQQVLGLTAERALLLLSVYWLGMIGGRLLLGLAGRRFPPAGVLYAAIALGLVGALTMVAGRSALVVGAGGILLGAGFAPVFPVLMGFGGDRHPALSGTAFSVLLVIALTGGTALPWATGLLGDVVGLRASFLLVPAGLLAMAGLFTLARSGLRRGNPAG